MERILIIVGALFAIAQAGPIQISQNAGTCATTCTDSTKFAYKPGSTYTYQYDSNIRTEVQGASEDHASLQMSATVQLEVISKCEISMRLGDVQLKEYDPEGAIMKDVLGDFKEGLQKFPVRLSFQDGQVEQLCLTGEEPTWVLNAKRGIISLIQNNMENFKTNHTVAETDVTGVCDTEYYVRESGWYTTTVGKTKNLLGCTERHGYNTAVQAVPYTAESNIQSLPLLKSDHNCIHEIDTSEGYLKSVTCQEEHVFRPFSKSNSGAVTSNKQTLTFIKVTSGTKRPATIKNTASLKFDHIYDVDKENKDRKDLTRKLLEICEKTKSGVLPETPKLFTDLVYIMKTADQSAISSMYKMLKEEKICPENLYRTTKFFLDALPIAGTSASLDMMTALITSNEVTGLEADMWLTSLAFIKNPTIDMLKSVKPLINMPTDSEKAMLSVGTLVHSYCIQNGDCDNDEMVKAIISTFVNKMAPGCKVKNNNLRTTLMALRGIGNAGFATSAIPKLVVCMKVKQNPTEIRLSAIEAFRRMPCDSSRTPLMAILQDTDEDSEIRIAAYKVLMECPSDKVLEIVKRTLASEEVNQVGSYIWTHLTNLMETSDRHKQDLRSLLEDETFKKEFDLDKRKFSRNYEGSVFVDQINTGAKVEGDLIWSSKSFIPRSGMMNLTFDLFGHSVNLFEFGGRAEGLEYFFESFFGPSGYFQAPATESAAVVPDNVDDMKMKKIDKRFSAQAADLRASMYMRVFGNELRYMNFRGMDSFLSGPDFNVLDMLIKLAEDNDYTYSHSTMFLDSSFIVPTATGFPLNLTVNGTATIDLRLKGKMDLRHPPSIDINGRIQPSAAVDISSMMSVDAFVTKSGVKMVSTLHTSTAVQGALKIDEKGSITSEYEMPEPKMEIIDVRSSFFTIHRDTEREQKMIKENTKFVDFCSPSKLVTITGLELCAEVTYPVTGSTNAPYFPLTGPASAGLYLYKRDTHTKYMMAAKSIHNTDSNIVKFTFDTPGSRTDRLVALDLNLNKKDLSVGMSLQSPWKKADVSGQINTDRKKSGINGVVQIDGQYPYSFDATLLKQKRGNVLTWTPSITIDVSKNTKISMTGNMGIDNWKKIDVSYEVEGVPMIPPTAQVSLYYKPTLVGIQCSVDVEKNKQYSTTLNLASTKYPKKIMYKPLASIRTPGKEIMGFGGSFGHYYGKGVDANLVLDINGFKQTTLKGKFITRPRGKRVLYNTKWDFRSGPADFSITGKVDNKNFRSIGTDFDITYVIRKFARNNIKIISKVTNLSASTLTKGKGNVIVQVKRNPEYNLKIMSEIEHNKKHTELDTDLWFGPNFKDVSKHMDFRFEMNRNLSKNSGNFLTRYKFPYMDLSMTAKGAHSHDSKNVDSNLYIKFGKNQPIETSIQFHDKTGTMVSVTSDLKLSSGLSNLGIGLDIDQPTVDAYVSNFRMFANNKRNTITTIVKPNEEESVVIDSEIKLFNQSTLQLQGKFRLNPSNFKTDLSYEKDAKKYAASLKSATEFGNFSWINADLLHPDRHVVFSVSGKTINNVIYGSADVNWNADHSNDDRIAASGWIEPPSADRLNGSISLTYPSRKLILNAYHLHTAKYTTHADFQWAPNKKIGVDTVMGFKGQSLIGNAKISTPFTQIPNMNLDLTYSENNEEYNMQTAVTWGKSETLSLESYVKKPISLNTLVGSLNLKSSIQEVKKMRLVFDHKLSSSLASSVDFMWNKQSIKADVVVQNTTKGKRLAYEGAINLQTTYKVVKKATFNVAFDSNGKTYNSLIRLIRNKKKYAFISTMTNIFGTNGLANDGSITIKSPTETYGTEWNHKHTDASVDTSVTSTWGKSQQIIATLKSTFDGVFDTTVSIETPFKSLKSGRLTARHNKQDRSLESKLALYQNEEVIGMTEAIYKLGDDSCTATFEISVPAFSLNPLYSKVELSMKEEKAFSARLNAITPAISLSIEGSTQRMVDGISTNSELLWKSSIPGYEQVRFTYEILDGEYLTSTSALEYNTDKRIQLETKFSLTRMNKHISATLRTPFESMPYTQAGLDMQGDLDNFVSGAFIEIQPVLDRRSTGLSWNTKSGVEAKLSVESPSGQTYSLTAMLNNDKAIVGKATLSIPGQRDIAASFNHYSAFNEISSNFEVQNNRKNSLKATLTVNANNKWKISASGNMRFELLSETEEYGIGYEYEGVPTAFTTQAEFSTTSDGISYVNIFTDFKNGMEGKVVIKSPYIKNIKASFNHDHSPTYLRSNADIIYGGRKTVDLQASLNTEDPVIGNINIKTPVYKDISLMTRLDGHIDNFVLRTEGTYGEKNAELELRSAVGPTMLQQKLIVRALEKEITMELNHNGGFDSFKTFAECNIGLERHRTDVSFSAINDIEGTILIESPLINPVSASFLLKGALDDFKSRVECNIASNRSSLDMSFKMAPIISGEINIRSPYTNDIFLNMNHAFSGSMLNTSAYVAIENVDAFDVSLQATGNAVNAQYTFGDLKSEIDASLDISNPYEGRLNLKTHLFPELSASFQHKGIMSNFRCHAEYTLGSDKSELDMSFNGIKSLKGSLEVQSYLTRPLSLTFSHSGELLNFNSQGEMVFGSDHVGTDLKHQLTSSSLKSAITFTSSFSDDFTASLEAEKKSRGYYSKMSITSPYTPAISISGQYKGVPTEFVTQYSAIIGENNFNGQVNLNVGENIEGGFKHNRPNVALDVSITKAETSLSVLMDEDSYMASLKYPSLTSDSIMLDGKITSPIEGYRHVTAAYQHQGSLRNIHCNGQMSIEGADSTSEFKLDTRNLKNIVGSLDISSPYMPSTSVQLSHTIDTEKYLFSADLSADNKKVYGYNLRYNDGANKQGKIELTLNGTVHNVVDFTVDRSQFDISSGMSQIKGALTLDSKKIGTLSINSPYIPTVEMNFDYTGTILNFDGQTQLVVDGEKWMHFESSLKSDEKKTATFILEIPEEKYAGQFSLIPLERSLQMSAKVSNDVSSLVDTTFEFNSNDKLLVDFALKSSIPHELSMSFYLSNIESSVNSKVDITHENNNILNGEFDYEASPINLQGKGNVVLGGIKSSVFVLASEEEKTLQLDADTVIESERWSFNTKYDGKRDIDASFTIAMPNRDDIKGTLIHNTRRFKSGTTARLQLNSAQSIEVETSQLWKNEYIGIASLKTPFKGFELSVFKLTHMGSMPNIKSSGDMQIDGEEYSVSIDTSNAKSRKADINIKTPFEICKDISLMIHLDGEMNNFKTGGKISYATGKAIELEVEHMLVGLNLQSSLRFMSPYTEAIVISANNTGTPTAFTNSFKLATGEDNSFSSYTTMNMGQAFLSFSSEQTTELSGEKFKQKLEIKHDGPLDNFKTEVNFDSLAYKHSLDLSFKLEPVIEGSLGIMTPYNHFEDVRVSFSHKGSSSGLLSMGAIEYAPNKIIKGKIDAQYYNWKRVISMIELNTPFKDMKTNKIEYEHTYRTGMITCQLEGSVFNRRMKANLGATMSPLSIDLDVNTPVEGFENIGFHGNYLTSSEQISSRIQAQWNTKSKIIADLTCTLQGPVDVRMFITSPFEQAKELSITFEHADRPNGWKQSVKLTHNSNVIVDGDLDSMLSFKQTNALLKIRSPWPMKFEADGAYSSDSAHMNIYADWNTNDKRSNLKFEGAFDMTTKKTINIKVIQSSMYGGVMVLRGELEAEHSSGSLSFGDETYGYDVQIGEDDGNLKVILPSRSLELSGSHKGRFTEGSFMWDADVDQTKRIAFKSNIYPSKNLLKSDVSISLPSIGKDLQLGSQFTLNQGRVLFEGTTELSYSGDARRKIMLISKLEDISSYGNKNYSFSFGVSHPYSTVDIKVNSHVGKSNNKYSAGVDLEYLTIRQQTKKFQIGGSIDQIKKTISFELLSPVKTISISGSAQTGDKFRLSLLNAYDQKRPLYTYLTVDSSARTVDFSMNYDLDNPNNEVRMFAQYVNSSAVAAEVFHTVQGSRVTDILTTARLNNSHLLHSRIHWRPELLQDLKSFVENEQADYKMRLHELEGTVISSIRSEIDGKLKKIQYAIEEQIGTQNMVIFNPLFQRITEINYNFRQMPRPVAVQIPRYTPQNASPAPENEVYYLPAVRQSFVSSFESLHEGIKMLSDQAPQFASKVLTNTTTMDLMKKYGLDNLLETSVREFIAYIEDKLEAELYDAETIILSYLKSPFTVYDPEHGEIQIELHSIFPIQSLDKVPAIDVVKYITDIIELTKDYIPEKPELSIPNLSSEWLPPFTGVATVANGHKITTFDGYVYDLDVDCTYVLARDYEDGNFSLILSNEGDTTLTVLASGKPISMNEQGQVLLGGEEMETPFTEGYVTVSKIGTAVNIKGGNHFNINYSPDLDHMEISVNGWYHGKTGGLLGTYDNEPSNDLMTSFGKVIKDSSRVARTWTVGVNSC